MKTYYSKVLDKKVTVPENEIQVIDGTTVIGYYNGMDDLIENFFRAPHVGFNRRMQPQNYSYLDVDKNEWISWLVIAGELRREKIEKNLI